MYKRDGCSWIWVMYVVWVPCCLDSHGCKSPLLQMSLELGVWQVVVFVQDHHEVLLLSSLCFLSTSLITYTGGRKSAGIPP